MEGREGRYGYRVHWRGLVDRSDLGRRILLCPDVGKVHLKDWVMSDDYLLIDDLHEGVDAVVVVVVARGWNHTSWDCSVLLVRIEHS